MARRHTKTASASPQASESADSVPEGAAMTSGTRPVVVAPIAPPSGRLVFLTPDWLPVALVIGDAVIAAISVPLGYWIKYANATQVLPFGPYLAAIPVVVVLYLFSLSVTGQYRSCRGPTLFNHLFPPTRRHD